MRRTFSILILFSIIFSSSGLYPVEAASGFSQAGQPSAQGETRQRMIVAFASAAAMRRFQSSLERSRDGWIYQPPEKSLPGTMINRFEDFNMMLVDLTRQQAERLARDPDVLYIEADATYKLIEPVGFRLAYQGVTPSEEYGYGLASMGVTRALHDSGYRGQGVKIGVIDSGVAGTHTDLNVHGGWNFYNGGLLYGDVLGHGTHVAGTIAAELNGYGVAGVAPEALIYSLRVCDMLGNCSLSGIINSIQWALDHDLDIVNMSLGGDQRSSAFQDVVRKAYASGLLMIAAAGNSGRSNDNVIYPAKYAEVIAVSAIDSQDQIATFSSRGPAVEFAAPGVEVLSTFVFPPYYEATYEYLSGTSMATPHVSGLAALIIGANPGISNVEVRRRMGALARDLGAPGRDTNYGFGVPQADRLLGVPNQAAPVAVAGGPYRGAAGAPLQFSAAGTLDADDNILSYHWSFGDGASSGLSAPQHTYRTPGNYTAILTVRDRDGLQSTASAQVQIRSGILREVRIGASGAGYVRSGSAAKLSSKVLAGMSMGKPYIGLMRFHAPANSDFFLLSASLEMTGSMNSTPEEGVISVGVLPDSFYRSWPDLSYATVSSASVLELSPRIELSHLLGQVEDGRVNRFQVPRERLTEFEGRLTSGGAALRVTMSGSKNASWNTPVLLLRYLEQPSLTEVAPIAKAGINRRVYAGQLVALDGSGSYDPDGDPLSYRWVQLSGPAVSLQSPNNPLASFSAPSGDAVLVFELRVSDGVFQVTDQVKFWLNQAPAEIFTQVITTAFGRSGYVDEDFPEMNFFNKAYMFSGVPSRPSQLDEPGIYGQVIQVGALQFDLGSIPPGYQVVSAALELTGAHRRKDHDLYWQVNVLESAVDLQWERLNYHSVRGARVDASLSPRLNGHQVGEDVVNRFNVSASLIEERRRSTGKITFRIDGPTILYGTAWEWFVWWSGNRADVAHMAPRLIVEYGAIAATEPPGTTPLPPTPTALPPTPTATSPSPTSTPPPGPTAIPPTPTPRPPTPTPRPPTPTPLPPTPTTPPACSLTVESWLDLLRLQPDEISRRLPQWLGTAQGRYSIQVVELGLAGRILRMELGGPSNGIARLYAQTLAARFNQPQQAAILATLDEVDRFLSNTSYQQWNSLSRDQRYQVAGWLETLESFNLRGCPGG